MNKNKKLNRIKNSLSRNKAKNNEQARLKGLVADLNQSHEDMGVEIQRQFQEIEVKNKQLKKGVQRQIKSQKQIVKQREELLHVTRVENLRNLFHLWRMRSVSRLRLFFLMLRQLSAY